MLVNTIPFKEIDHATMVALVAEQVIVSLEPTVINVSFGIVKDPSVGVEM